MTAPMTSDEARLRELAEAAAAAHLASASAERERQHLRQSRFSGLSREGSRFNGVSKMTPLREQQRRASALYLQGRVRVGVTLMATVDAGEDRLVLAASRVNDTAGRTCLRGERGGDVNQPAPYGFEFVFQHGGEHAPPLRQDRSVQPRLLPNPFVSGATRHSDDLKFLERHCTEASGDAEAGNMQMVLANAGILRSQPAHPRSLFGVAARAAPSPGEYTLRSGRDLLQPSRVRKIDVFTIRQADSVGHSSVDSYARQMAQRRGRRANVTCEGDVPFARRARDGRRFHGSGQRASLAKANPSNLWKFGLRPLSIEGSHLNFAAAQASSVVQSQAAGRRIPATTEERGIGLVEIVERGFLDRLGDRSDPVEFSAESREFPPLTGKADAAPFASLILPPEVAALLQRQVVDQARHTDPLADCFGLGGCRMQRESKASKHCQNTTTFAGSQP